MFLETLMLVVDTQSRSEAFLGYKIFKSLASKAFKNFELLWE